MRLTFALLLALAVPAAAQPRSCRDEIGPQRSMVLVNRCLDVTPATHPPCNASNDCAMIRNEIARSCKMLPDAPDKPSWCAAYTGR